MSEENQKDQKNERPKQSMDEAYLKKIVEALIFASDKPLPIQQVKDILENVDTRIIRRLINELNQEYLQNGRAFSITEVAGGFQFSTDPAYGRWLKKLYNIKQSDYLTGPSLETLAIIAYRQPVTKADIEFIRGVNVDGVMSNLTQKGFIKISGRKDVVGRPFLYRTTNLFLQYFGLNSLEELPALPEFQESELKFQKEEEKTIVEVEKDDSPSGDDMAKADKDAFSPEKSGGSKDAET